MRQSVEWIVGRAWWRRLWPTLIAGVLVLSLAVPPSAAGKKTRDYSASIAPTADAAGHEGAGYSLAIANSDASDVSLGSANVTVPAGYSDVAVGTVTASAGKAWTAALVDGVIQLRAVPGGAPPDYAANALEPGQAVTVTLAATAPCPNGSYTWTTQAKEGITFSGANFALIGPQPTVAIAGNCSPAVAADQASVTVAEGQAAANSGTYADPNPGDSVAIIASAGTVTQTGASSGTWSWSLLAADGPAAETITITADDGNGGVATAAFGLTITNAAPTATFIVPAAVDEGSAITLSLADPCDPSPVDTAAGFTYAFDCGDGSGYGPFAVTSTNTCPTTDEGVRAVGAKIQDKDGGVTEYTAVVTVSNVAPVVTPAPDQGGPEGTSLPLGLGSFVDPGADGPWTVDVDWGDGITDTFAVSATGEVPAQAHVYADDGTYTVTVRIADQDGGWGSGSFQVAVSNEAPVVHAAGDQVATMGVASSFELGSFSDPGLGDSPWQVEIAWGDGITDTFAATSQGPLGSLLHTYSSAGSFTVVVTVQDKDGGTAYDTFQASVAGLYRLYAPLILRQS